MTQKQTIRELSEKQLRSVIQFLLKQNLAHTSKDPSRVGLPLCIWGPHGIGKTAIAADIARENGWHFAYCAPGQFEEMGDFHGLPVLEVLPDGRKVTKTAPPEWVPTQEGPGILLLDDLNRADDRILRGLMQLLQTHQIGSWKLPRHWQILATANPEGSGYSVTQMDEAMLTRMLHFHLKFDANVWAAWATRQGVDPRGISFVLSYPETTKGKRTTARTLTQFFGAIGGIQDLTREITLVRQIARSCLDEETVKAFTVFVQEELSQLPTPEEILHATSSERTNWINQVLLAAMDRNGIRRVDRLAVVLFRVLLYIGSDAFEPSKVAAANFIELFKLPVMPKDLTTGQIPSLLASQEQKVRSFLSRPDVQGHLTNQFIDELLTPVKAA